MLVRVGGFSCKALCSPGHQWAFKVMEEEKVAAWADFFWPSWLCATWGTECRGCSMHLMCVGCPRVCLAIGAGIAWCRLF